MQPLRKPLSERYADVCAQRKVLNFAKAFLTYVAKTRFDPRYQAFDLFLELPKALKEHKRVTERIVTTEDVRHVLATIQRDYEGGDLPNASVATLLVSCYLVHLRVNVRMQRYASLPLGSSAVP